MKQRISETSRGIDLLMILAFLIVARISCPALSNLPFFSMAFTFGYGVVFLVLYLLIHPSISKKEFALLATMATYTLWVVGKSIALGQGLFARDAFNAYIIIFLTVIFLWSKRQSQERQRALLGLILITLTFNYIYSIRVLRLDPDASRIAAATSVLEKSPYDVLNAVGSFDAVYGGISVVAILLFMLRFHNRYNLQKWIIMAILSLAVVFMYMAAYATALLLLLFTVALVFSRNNKLLAGLLVVSLLLILVFHETVGLWIMKASVFFSESEIIQDKVLEFGEMLKTFEATGTYAGHDGRAARMQWSINAFGENPLFGGYGKTGVRIGGHSELMDILGKYGIVGFGLLTAFFVTLYQEIKERLQDSEMNKCSAIILFVWVIAAILNPALYSLQMMPIILMLPLSTAYKNQTVAD